MSNPFLGQITQVAFSFPPRQYAWCDGTLLSIEQNTALYTLLYTQFGGNGTTTFRLPNLQGRAPIHPTGTIDQGTIGGLETVTLTESTMPFHTHGFTATTSEGDFQAAYPSGEKILSAAELYGASVEPQKIYAEPNEMISLNTATMTNTGGGGAHTNLQPSLVIGFVIALTGVYPHRS